MPPISASGITSFWPLLAAVISFLALCMAWISEFGFGLVPCPLCMTQRHVYWTAIFVGLTSFVGGHTLNLIFNKVGNAILALVFAYGVYIATYHAGVEWEVFAPPGGCSGDGANLSFNGGLNLDAPVSLTDCIKPPFRVLSLSMAGWNILLYAALLVASICAAVKNNAVKAAANAQ